MIIDIFTTALEQTLVLAPMVFGMYVSYRILKITDLTVDGSYVLGAVLFAKMMRFGIYIAFFSGVLAGMIAGSFSAFMQRNNRVNGLIAGILASFMLYSINLMVLGRPNVSLIGLNNILSMIGFDNFFISLFLICIVAGVLVVFVLISNLGLFLRAFGQNIFLLKRLGYNVEYLRMFGLALSNGLASISGVLACQVNGFVDINMGAGVALVCIGSVITGDHLFTKNKFSPLFDIVFCFFGAYIYFLLLGVFLSFGIEPVAMKLFLGLFLFIVLSKASKCQ